MRLLESMEMNNWHNEWGSFSILVGTPASVSLNCYSPSEHTKSCLLVYNHWERETERDKERQRDREMWNIFLGFIIIIMSCLQHGYLWPSLVTSPYYSSPLADLKGYILCPHIAAVCMFELVVLLLLGHMRGSIGVHHLWARPCFSSSVLRVWFV